MVKTTVYKIIQWKKVITLLATITILPSTTFSKTTVTSTGALILPELQKCIKQDIKNIITSKSLMHTLNLNKLSPGNTRISCTKSKFCSSLKENSNYLKQLNSQLLQHFNSVKKSQQAIKRAVEYSFLKTTRALLLLSQELQNQQKSSDNIDTRIAKLYKGLSNDEIKQLRIIYTNIVPFFKDQNKYAILPSNTLQDLQTALIKITSEDDPKLKVTKQDIDLLNATYATPNKKHGISTKRFFSSFINQMRSNYPYRNFLKDDLRVINKKILHKKGLSYPKMKQLKKDRMTNIKKLANFIQSIKNSVAICKLLYPSTFKDNFTIKCLDKPIPEILTTEPGLKQFSQQLISYLDSSFELTPYVSVASLKISACFDASKQVTVLKFKRLPNNQEWTVISPTSNNNPILQNKKLQYEITRTFKGHPKQIVLHSNHKNTPKKIQVTDTCQPPTPVVKQNKIPVTTTVVKKPTKFTLNINTQEQEQEVNFTSTISSKKKGKWSLTCTPTTKASPLTYSSASSQKEIVFSLKKTNEKQQYNCIAKQDTNSAQQPIIIPALNNAPPVFSVAGDSVEGSTTDWTLLIEAPDLKDTEQIECKVDQANEFSITKETLQTHIIKKTDKEQIVECTWRNITKNTQIPIKDDEEEGVVEDTAKTELQLPKDFTPMHITPVPPPQLIQIPPKQPFILPGMP